jgi:hypothetical protein
VISEELATSNTPLSAAIWESGGGGQIVLGENECMGQLDAGDETNREYTLEGST